MTAGSGKAYRISADDTVAVALEPIAEGEVLPGDPPVTVRQAIPRGHKVAIKALACGESVLKFGAPIGRAKSAISAGEHVHSHNLETTLAAHGDYVFRPDAPRRFEPRDGVFMGYRRPSGKAGTRNEIWVIATVGCVANLCLQIAQRSHGRHSGRIDGVHALTHPFGCSQLGDDLDGTRAILARLATHPNAGGVLIVGLGCESNQADALLAAAEGLDPARVRVLRAQTEADELGAGLAAVDELVAIAAGDERTPCAASDLVIGLKCGGSDGFSGLTANPLLGRLAERLTASGGSAILTEIPEIFGAEHLLMARATDESVFERIGALTNRFKAYFVANGQPVHENPSPGNKDGGITTLEEKSLGAVQKAGRAPVGDAIDYAGVATKPGVTLLGAPGNDAVSGTALAAAGATLILFTTGRGTPLGFPVPTVKVASNTALAARKPNWIDFDAGVLVAGADQDVVDEAFWSCVLDIASGAPARNERNDERAIAIWKRGVTL